MLPNSSSSSPSSSTTRGRRIPPSCLLSQKLLPNEVAMMHVRKSKHRKTHENPPKSGGKTGELRTQ